MTSSSTSRFYKYLFCLLSIITMLNFAACNFLQNDFTNTGNNTMSYKVAKGSRLPSFVLKDQNGEDFDIQSVIGNQNMVVYFYPKDDTPGCTKEACSFRDEFEEFKDANAIVIGISADSPESHNKFAKKYNLPFILLSDPGNKVRKQFGVPGNLFGLIPGRVTYVADKNGIVQHVFNSQSNAEQHVQEAKRILESL